MTIEYIVLGALLIIMGAAQMYLRHSPRFKPNDEAGDEESKDWNPEEMPRPFSPKTRSGTGWTIWTGILGPIAIAFGIFIVVLGVLGR